MKQFISASIGLLFGITGAILYQKTLPPPEGSLQETLEKTEHKNAQLLAELADFRAKANNRRIRDTTSDRARRIAEALRNGERVSADDVFNATKPLMRDLSPLFDRMRQVQESREFDRIAGEASRKYDLTDQQKKNLKNWLVARAEQNAERFRQVFRSEESGFVDMVLATNESDHTEGLDDFMSETLTGDALENYQEQRLTERIGSVQAEADVLTNRIDSIVDLTDEQESEVYMLMARSSSDFSSDMQFEGMSGDSTPISSKEARTTALLSALDAEQRSKYETHRNERREEAERQFRDIGIGLPANWDLLEDDEF